MVVRGTHLDTAQMASLVVTVATQNTKTKRSVGSDEPKNTSFEEVSQHAKTFANITLQGE